MTARFQFILGLLIWLVINLFPVYWMFTFSLKNNQEIFGENVIGLPKHWLWSTFSTLLLYLFLSKKIQESFIAGTIKG